MTKDLDKPLTRAEQDLWKVSPKIYLLHPVRQYLLYQEMIDYATEKQEQIALDYSQEKARWSEVI